MYYATDSSLLTARALAEHKSRSTGALKQGLHIGCLEEASKSGQVLLNGLEAAQVRTLI